MSAKAVHVVPEIPGPQVRAYRGDRKFLGLTIPILLQGNRLCRLYVARHEDEPCEPRISCEDWATDDHIRRTIEQCIVDVLNAETLPEVKGRRIQVEPDPNKKNVSRVVGAWYTQEFNTREITMIANRFFALLRVQLQKAFPPQPSAPDG